MIEGTKVKLEDARDLALYLYALIEAYGWKWTEGLPKPVQDRVDDVLKSQGMRRLMEATAPDAPRWWEENWNVHDWLERNGDNKP